MSDESKPVGPPEEDPKGKGRAVAEESDDEIEVADELGAIGEASTNAKKKSKRKKIKEALTGKSSSSKDDKEVQLHKALDNLTSEQVTQLLDLNPALASEISKSGKGGGNDAKSAIDALKSLKLQEIMTGLAASGKNVKDMGAYKFWSTQPVTKFDEAKPQIGEGPIRIQTLDHVPKQPAPLITGFEWCEMDLMNNDEIKEVWELLNGHYVEDDEEMFRFNYSASILKWAMMPPGWKKQWHIGVRASQSRKLVAFISAIPLDLRVRKNVIHASEVNFLCIHKKLRSKRLAPVLIKEITRLCNLESVWQALYTAGTVLPTPFSTCRYYHRAINWSKLWEVGFSPLPHGSKPAFQIRKYALPDNTALRGLREMQEKDVDAVHDLLTRYLHRYDMCPEFTKEDVTHWLLHNKKKEQLDEQVIWSYVVEDEHKKITDFFSFYCLESSVIRDGAKHKNIRAAYLFYYATETGLDESVDKEALKTRLNALVNDCMVLCKKYNFDVLNALSLMDNALFLEERKFGAGDGQLHYYLFNYRTNPIAGGVDQENKLDKETLSGVGLVML